MDTRRTLLRSAAVLALAVTIVGSTALTPSASAAPVDNVSDLHSVAAKKKNQQTTNNDNQTNDNESSASEGEGGLSDIPIIGDVVGSLENAEPEEIVSGAVQFAGVAAETIVPLIRSLIK